MLIDSAKRRWIIPSLSTEEEEAWIDIKCPTIEFDEEVSAKIAAIEEERKKIEKGLNIEDFMEQAAEGIAVLGKMTIEDAKTKSSNKVESLAERLRTIEARKNECIKKLNKEYLIWHFGEIILDTNIARTNDDGKPEKMTWTTEKDIAKTPQPVIDEIQEGLEAARRPLPQK